MNLNKARDFYSAYFEGTLDEGLRQAFERARASDAQVAAEYAQFERIMLELKALDSPVAVPADLHTTIRRRVDDHINASEKKARSTALFFAWKPIAYGAVATAAIIGVLASFSNRPSDGPARAGLATIGHNEAPRFLVEEGTLRLKFASAGPNVVTVSEVETGRQLLKKPLVGQRIDSPLKNLSDDAVLLVVGFAEGYRPMHVALPGSSRQLEQQGSGTVLDLVTAIAGMYDSPVVLDTSDISAKAAWDLDSPDVLTAVKDELAALGMKAEVRESGLLWISSN
jgi:hypothetical protein